MQNAPYDYEREEAIDHIVETQMQNLDRLDYCLGFYDVPMVDYMESLTDWRQENV